MKKPASPLVPGCALLSALRLVSCTGGSPQATPPTFQQSWSHAARHTTSSCPCIYVANPKNNSVTVYPVGATGNVAPIQLLKGSMTKLSQPYDIAVDGSGNIYVANYNSRLINRYRVTEYAAGSTGNVAPIAVISGSRTKLDLPSGIAMDPVNGDIYVETLGCGNDCLGAVAFYAAGSNGNVKPSGMIAGSNTKLLISGGLTLDPSGNVYVSNSNQSITTYAAGSVGNVAPTSIISGSNTGLGETWQLALDSSSNIYAANNSDILVFAAGANGNVTPIRTLSGPETKLEAAVGVALDGNDNLYVANLENNSITVYAAGTNGNVAPTEIIKGSETKLSEPLGIAIH